MQRRLRERDAASAEVRAVAMKGAWFLNDTHMNVAQGHYAVPAALFGSGSSLAPAGDVCRRVLYFLSVTSFVCVCVCVCVCVYIYIYIYTHHEL